MKLSAKIGVIQMTDKHFRVVIVKTGSVPPKVLEWKEASFPPPGDDAALTRLERVEIVRTTVSELKLTPTIWIYNAPQVFSVMRQLSVPFNGRRKVRAALTFELEPYLAIPIENLIIDHIPIREVDGKTEVFVIGLQKRHAAEQLALLQDAGVHVESIGLDIVGLAALGFETVVGKNASTAMILWQDGNSYLTIMHNDSLAYVQRIVSDPQQIVAWTQEVQNGLRAFQANALEPVEIAGLTCSDPRLSDEQYRHISEQLELDVTPATLGVSWAPAELLQADDCSDWMAMIGSASAGAGGVYNVSFTRESLEEVAAPSPYRKHIAVVVALVVIALVAHLSVTSLKTAQNQDAIEQRGGQVYTIMAETFPAHAAASQRPAADIGGFKSYAAMEEALDHELQTGTALTPEMLNQPSLPNLLREISTHMPNRLVAIDSITMMPRRAGLEITIKGSTKNSDAFGKVTEGLEGSTMLSIADRKRSSRDGKDTFTITAHVIETNQESS
ncbi:MAG: hypothetical protein VCD00_20200 [Candidatus Hydrogenedentota bacterium]